LFEQEKLNNGVLQLRKNPDIFEIKKAYFIEKREQWEL